jgi:hypothetical protein
MSSYDHKSIDINALYRGCPLITASYADRHNNLLDCLKARQPDCAGPSTLDDRQTPFPWKPRLCGNLGYLCPKMVFWDLVARGKSPKVSVLEPDSFQQWYDRINYQNLSTHQPDRGIFQKIWHACPS